MNVVWAKVRLEEYLALLGRFSPSTTSSGQFSGGDRSVMPELQEREPTVRDRTARGTSKSRWSNAPPSSVLARMIDHSEVIRAKSDEYYLGLGGHGLRLR
jgi:hypothetical protein